MRSFASSLTFAAGVYAQSQAYTDANTGISFQTHYDNTGTGLSFGVAVPTTAGTDFIGQIVRVPDLNICNNSNGF